MELRTDRLILRRPQMADGPAIVTAINHWDVARWVSGVPHPYTLQDAHDYITAITADGRSVWMIFQDHALIGGTGIANGFGYWLTPTAWGQGFATEAGQAALAWHFGQSDETVESQYLNGNTGSARVLSKLGFREIGASTCSSRAAGENLPSIRCVLTKADWNAKR